MSPLRTVIVALLALATIAPQASAGSFSDQATGCTDRKLERVFAPWLDPISYVLMPDGGLEAGGRGWRLAGGAKVVSGNEPFHVGSRSDSRSLALPSGSSATTAPTCTGLDHPVMRFFARRTGGSPLATLRVDALYETRSGTVRSAPNVGVVLGLTSRWQPTLPMVVLGSLLAPVLDDRAVVAFRFRPSPGSSWRIDDVYLDPFAKR